MHAVGAIQRATDAPRVGVLLPTCGLYPVVMTASWALGRTIVPLNPLLRPREMAVVIEDAGLDTVVTVEPVLDLVGGLPDGVVPLCLESLPMRRPPIPRGVAPMDGDFVAVLMYTSGTSGKPKGVMLTSDNLLANVRQCAACGQFTRTDAFLGVLPQFHSFGLTVTTLLPMMLGARVIYSARFRPGRILSLLRTWRPAILLAIPSMFNALLASKKAEPGDFESLRFVVSGAEPLPDAVYEGFLERFGVEITEGYGLTETAPASNLCRPGAQRRGTVGPALEGIEQRIVSPDGRVLPPGCDGEIRMRGPNVMAGYHGLPEETAAVFDEDGFFRTGDMGRLDEDGFLSITGRIKEMLIIGGENVFPREIEEVLNAHPTVHDAGVIGVADPSRGEVPIAFVELVEDASFDAAAIRSHCREHMARFKVPSDIRLVDALPRSATGKILRRELAAGLEKGEGD